MKKTIKLICFFLAVSMVALIFCGCGKGMLLATYDGGEVYSTDKDVKLWTKYLSGYYGSYILEGKMTSAELGKIIVKTIVAQRIREIEVAKRGLSISESEVEEMYEYNKKAFDENYEGGFKKMMKD